MQDQPAPSEAPTAQLVPRGGEGLPEGAAAPEPTTNDVGTPLLTHPRFAPGQIFPVALSLARALAVRHAAGSSGGVTESSLLDDGTVVLGSPGSSTPREDVHAAARLLVERAIGTLPPSPQVRVHDLLVHLPQLVPAAPVDLVAVLTRALSPEPGLRPRNGLDLWEQLASAQAIAAVRRDAPHRPLAKLEIGSDTHIGAAKARRGQTNQDAVFWEQDGAVSVLLVADGISVSTAGSGDLASGLLVEVVSEAWTRQRVALAHDPPAAEAFVRQTLAEANHVICARTLEAAGGSLGQEIPMGTTALLAVVCGDKVVLGALGDSRAYLIGAAGAVQLTGDENLRGEWLRGTQLGMAPQLHGDGHALVGYCGHFGMDASSEPLPVQVLHTRLLPGEVLAMCSDGITDYAAGSASACALLFEEATLVPDLQAACRGLVERANAGGGGDNASVLLARQSEG